MYGKHVLVTWTVRRRKKSSFTDLVVTFRGIVSLKGRGQFSRTIILLAPPLLEVLDAPLTHLHVQALMIVWRLFIQPFLRDVSSL